MWIILDTELTGKNLTTLTYGCNTRSGGVMVRVVIVRDYNTCSEDIISQEMCYVPEATIREVEGKFKLC